MQQFLGSNYNYYSSTDYSTTTTAAVQTNVGCTADLTDKADLPQNL